MRYYSYLSKTEKGKYINETLCNQIKEHDPIQLKNNIEFFKKFNSLKTLDDKYKVAQLVETEIKYFYSQSTNDMKAFASKFNTTKDEVLEKMLIYTVDYYKALTFYNTTIVPVSHPVSEYSIGSEKWIIQSNTHRKEDIIPKNRSPYRHYVIFLFVPVVALPTNTFTIELGVNATLMEFNDDDFDNLTIGFNLRKIK